MRLLGKDLELINDHYSQILNELRGSSFLITGGTGMINMYLSRVLSHYSNEYDYDVDIHVRNKNKAEKLLGDIQSEKVRFVSFDLSKKIESEKKWNYILHGAGLAGNKWFVEKPVDVIEPNVIGTWNLLNYAKCNDNVKRFIMYSSRSVYGGG